MLSSMSLTYSMLSSTYVDSLAFYNKTFLSSACDKLHFSNSLPGNEASSFIHSFIYSIIHIDNGEAVYRSSNTSDTISLMGLNWLNECINFKSNTHNRSFKIFLTLVHLSQSAKIGMMRVDFRIRSLHH